MKKMIIFIFLLSFLMLVGCLEQISTDEELFVEEAEEGSAVAGQAIQVGACPTSRTTLTCAARGDGSYDVTYRSGRTGSVSRTLANSCSTVRGAVQAFQVLGCRAVTSSKGSTSTVVEYCTFQCETGETCQDGFCVRPEEPPVCTDSDGSDGDHFIRGTVSGTLGVSMLGIGVRGDVVEVTDACVGGSVREWTCDAGTNYVTSTLAECHGTYGCQDGVCVSLCGNGVVDDGESCTSCAADVRCAAGQTCIDRACVTPPEICDGTDNNANSVIDEGCDDDNDGFCDASMTFTPISGTSTCGGGGTVINSNCCWYGGGDCNDTADSTRPRTGIEGNDIGLYACRNTIDDDCDGIVNDGCPETLCNDIDDDADGTIDGGCDDDGDDYCDSALTTVGTPTVCPNGGGDCADWSSDRNPRASQVCFTSTDTNCDGNYHDGCAPYACSDSDPSNDPALGGAITITAANGETYNYTYNPSSSDRCINAASINQSGCAAASSSTSWWGLYAMAQTMSCPAGTTCSDSDGYGSVGAVCS